VDNHPNDPLPPDRISVILHRPAIPENIGSVARGMMNTGFSKLYISSAQTDDWNTARKLAVSASGILDGAPRTSSLEEALSLSGAGHIVGTTGRDRKYWNPADVSQAVPVIMKKASVTNVSLVFGPENTGLSNEELTLCHQIVTLPAAGELESYNLSHAVILVLFQIMTAVHTQPEDTVEDPAGFETREGMYGHIQEVLTETGFLWEDNPDHMMRAVRGFLNERSPTDQEVKTIRGICRRLLWHLRNR
jgi:tRNA/rRNA methyltransferase